MLRLSTSLAVLFACTTLPAFAADWADEGWSDEGGGFRGTYSDAPKDWSGVGETDDSLHFETGLRYWYSMGSQSFGMGSQTFEGSDTTHTGELHLRIDDHHSSSYVKAWAGYSAAISGNYSDGFTPSDVPIEGGHVGYVGADFGWNVFSDGNGNGAGFLLGYQYWNDSPRMSRQNYTTATSSSDIAYDPATGQITGMPMAGVDNGLDINALRLGVSGRTKIGDMFDLSGEVAAVPFATVSGILGDTGFSLGTTTLGNPQFVKTSETDVNGTGYGAMAEAMVGVTPMENLTLRLGGRAWYLQGTADATYSAAQITDPTDSDTVNAPNYDTPPTITSPQPYIVTDNPWSLFRYGLLAELTYAF